MKNYCEKEELEIIGEIPDDRKVAEVYSEGRLVAAELDQYQKVFRNLAGNIEELLSRERKVKKEEIDVHSITVIDRLRGYLIVEADSEDAVKEAIRGMKHAKGVISGEVDIEEIQHFIEEKALTTEIERGDVVELTSGAFKGEKAKVKRIDEGKEKITLEIIEAEVPVPITVDASDVRVLPSEKEKYK